jgi:hypothetical protein
VSEKATIEARKEIIESLNLKMPVINDWQLNAAFYDYKASSEIQIAPKLVTLDPDLSWVWLYSVLYFAPKKDKSDPQRRQFLGNASFRDFHVPASAAAAA